MSLLANSANASQSATGVTGFLNIKSILSCCFKRDDIEHSVEIIEPKETLEVKEIESMKNEDFSTKEESEGTKEPDKEELENGEKLSLGPQSIVENEGNEMEADDNDTISEHDLNVVPVVGQANVEKTKTSELRLRINLDSERTSLLITVVDAYDLARPSSSMSSIREHAISNVPPVLAYSVHILILPLRKLRFKTKMRQGPDPFFDEVIKIPKINFEDLKTWSLRFRLYGSMRSPMKQILGEGFLKLESVNLEMRTECRIALMNYDSAAPENVVNNIIYISKCNQESLTSVEHIDGLTKLIEAEVGPEILIGLIYNFNTGRLTVEIIKGNKFPRLKESKEPDTLITVLLESSKGEEMAHSKTVVQRGSCEPVFEEKFIFPVLVFQLEEVKLTISGCHKKSLGKVSAFGAFTMGNINSSEEEENHWKDLIASGSGDQIQRWHTFQAPEKKK